MKLTMFSTLNVDERVFYPLPSIYVLHSPDFKVFGLGFLHFHIGLIKDK